MSQQINLLRPKDRSFTIAMSMLGLVGGGLVLLLGYYQSLRMDTSALRDAASISEQRLGHVRNLIQELQKHRTARGDATALNAEMAALRPRADAMNQLVNEVRNGGLGTPDGLSRYYDTLAGVAVDGLWITGISVSKSGTAVNIGGRALRSDLVTQYVVRLNQAFRPLGVQFNSLELTPEALSPPGPAGVPVQTIVAFKLS